VRETVLTHLSSPPQPCAARSKYTLCFWR